MKNSIFVLFFLFLSIQAYSEQVIPVFKDVLFFDGYAPLVSDSVYEEYAGKLPDAGVIRHKNSSYAVKLTKEQLSKFGDNIVMNVFINPVCDNYDRLANISLAMVPKGQNSYSPTEVNRYEIGRFITPFMDKNKTFQPASYSFNLNYLSPVFRDKKLLSQYDYWIEFEVFGVPYAANKEIAGCEGRSDVFFGSLEFVSPAAPAKKGKGLVLMPLLFKYQLNNYKEESTDELGKTIKSVKFSLDKNVRNARLVLITSNHGANSGGEEYNRRMHYIRFDNELMLEYKPGRRSCEPFRHFNTQRNGIYGRSEKTDEQWQAFSNWCPGDVIDTRIIELGNLKAGEHEFMIEVPEAQFVDKQGYIPVSLYLLGNAK
ncbi:hypothetical protein D0T49_05255 [Paludibacter sp. 221]|nr:hypothetical protein [Paludibacter sp. 221]